MRTKEILIGAAVFGAAGGYGWAVLPPVTFKSADERAAIPASVSYSGCSEVRAAGKAPLYAGQPGYRSSMDGDGDGIACEPHRRF